MYTTIREDENVRSTPCFKQLDSMIDVDVALGIQWWDTVHQACGWT